MSEQNEKLIPLPIKAGESWLEGEEVEVSLRASLSYKAVILMYVMPLIALLAVLFGMTYTGASELLSGLAALLAPMICYFIVWLFRDRIQKSYIFSIEKGDC